MKNINNKSENKEKILIITPGGLPFPSVKGGAVQNLIEHIVRGHEENNLVEMYVTAPMDEEAKKVADSQYRKSNFIWIKIPKFITFLDNCVYGIISAIFKHKQTISFRNNFKIMWYTIFVASYLRKNNIFQKVVIENNLRLFWAIKLFGNKKRYKDRYYLHLHNIPRSTLGCAKEIAGVKKVLCISDFQRNKICSDESKIGQLNKNQTVILKNCIDLSIFNNQKEQAENRKLKEKFSIQDDDKVLVFIGRISKEKGISETIKAFNNLSMKKVKLLIVGATYYNSKMVSKFEKEIYDLAKLNDNIIFTGYIDYSKIKSMYQIADIAILPSMWEEPAGLTMIEAMASGIPVISTYSGGIPEYLYDDCAVLIKRDQNIVENIEKNIIELLNNSSKREKLIEKGLKISSEYDSKKYYNNFIKLLD